MTATTHELVKHIIYAIILVFFFIGIEFFVSLSVTREIDIGNTANEIYVQRLMLSDSCLAFNDGTRTRIGIVDSTKANTKLLSNCLRKKEFAAQITIAYNNKTITAYNNEDSFIFASKLCFTKKYRCKQDNQQFIAIAENNTIYPAMINISTTYNVA